MKNVVFSVIILILVSCRSKESRKIFDESNYRLTKTQYYPSGKKSAEFFVNKEDTNKKLEKIYWENGRVEGLAFFSHRQLDGPFQQFDSMGNYLVDQIFIKDLESGVILQFERGKMLSYTLIYKGEEIYVDSSKNIHSWSK